MNSRNASFETNQNPDLNGIVKKARNITRKELEELQKWENKMDSILESGED